MIIIFLPSTGAEQMTNQSCKQTSASRQPVQIGRSGRERGRVCGKIWKTYKYCMTALLSLLAVQCSILLMCRPGKHTACKYIPVPIDYITD